MSVSEFRGVAQDRCIRLYGRPETVVSDNGTELTSRAILEWQNQTGIAWHYIAPDWAGSRQAAAEWLRRELQREAQRRMPERRSVRQPYPCPQAPREMAT